MSRVTTELRRHHTTRRLCAPISHPLRLESSEVGLRADLQWQSSVVEALFRHIECIGGALEELAETQAALEAAVGDADCLPASLAKLSDGLAAARVATQAFAEKAQPELSLFRDDLLACAEEVRRADCVTAEAARYRAKVEQMEIRERLRADGQKKLIVATDVHQWLQRNRLKLQCAEDVSNSVRNRALATLRRQAANKYGLCVLAREAVEGLAEALVSSVAQTSGEEAPFNEVVRKPMTGKMACRGTTAESLRVYAEDALLGDVGDLCEAGFRTMTPKSPLAAADSPGRKGGACGGKADEVLWLKPQEFETGVIVNVDTSLMTRFRALAGGVDSTAFCHRYASELQRLSTRSCWSASAPSIDACNISFSDSEVVVPCTSCSGRRSVPDSEASDSSALWPLGQHIAWKTTGGHTGCSSSASTAASDSSPPPARPTDGGVAMGVGYCAVVQQERADTRAIDDIAVIRATISRDVPRRGRSSSALCQASRQRCRSRSSSMHGVSSLRSAASVSGPTPSGPQGNVADAPRVSTVSLVQPEATPKEEPRRAGPICSTLRRVSRERRRPRSKSRRWGTAERPPYV